MPFDLCQTKKAEHPYYIRNIGIRVWTLEELCYYLYENLCLIDRSITNESLCAWVRDELGLVRLSRRLYDALDRPDGDISYFLMPIFGEIGYLSADQQRRVRDELTRLQVRPEDEKAKLKADYLVRCGRYAAAIRQYKSLLGRKGPGALGVSFYAGLWNNMGCAYALQHRFEEAADCFLQGWQLDHSRELLRRYVSTLPFYLPEEEYRQKLKEFGADPVLIAKIGEYNASVAEQAREKDAQADRSEDLGAALERLRNEYRRGAEA